MALGGGFAEFVKIQGLKDTSTTTKTETKTKPKTSGADNADGAAGAGSSGGSGVGNVSGDGSARGSKGGDDGGGGGGGSSKVGAEATPIGDSSAASAAEFEQQPPPSDTTALARWIKLRSLHRLSCIAEHGREPPHVVVEDVRFTVKQLMSFATGANMPPHQMELLVRSCNSLLHTVKVNDVLRPSSSDPNNSVIDKKTAEELFQRTSTSRTSASAPGSPIRSSARSASAI